ncbi:hypothetical protein [Zhongshania sp. BJYM1]|uniref:hypothetical protein n=1 Tax=Zhongshania aquatica TaxID=2965069 RepID=UPI0022B5E434|nr:hypothetical protein [Marortus sp. BJYM1]
MKFTKTLILLASLGLATSGAYADHYGKKQFDNRYQSHGKAYKHGHKKHDRKYYKDDHGRHYSGHYSSYYHDRHNDRYYVRHEHNRYCGHYYKPAFNTRVKVFLGI